MLSNKFIIYVSIVVIFAASANALKCWRCSSDATGANFCHDPFEADLVSEAQRRWSYVDCNFPPAQSNSNSYNSAGSRPVCKKMKQTINDKVVVSRSCSWEDINSPADACYRQNTPSYIRTEFCETCSHDGCNGAGQLASAFVLVAGTFLLKCFLL